MCLFLLLLLSTLLISHCLFHLIKFHPIRLYCSSNGFPNVNRLISNRCALTIELDGIYFHKFKVLHKVFSSTVGILSILISNSRKVNWMGDNFVIMWDHIPWHWLVKCTGMWPRLYSSTETFKTIG